MSSKLQLDVCHLNRWWRHLVNAYEVRQAWCLLQVKLCDPCLSEVVCIPCKVLYKCSAFTFTSWTSLVELSSGPDVTYGLFRQQLKGHLFRKYEHGAL